MSRSHWFCAIGLARGRTRGFRCDFRHWHTAVAAEEEGAEGMVEEEGAGMVAADSAVEGTVSVEAGSAGARFSGSRGFSGPSFSHSVSGSGIGNSSALGRSWNDGSSSLNNFSTSNWTRGQSNWQPHGQSNWQSARNQSTWQQHMNNWSSAQQWSHNNSWNHNNNWWNHNNWWGHSGFWWGDSGFCYYPALSIDAGFWLPWWNSGYDDLLRLRDARLFWPAVRRRDACGEFESTRGRSGTVCRRSTRG